MEKGNTAGSFYIVPVPIQVECEYLLLDHFRKTASEAHILKKSAIYICLIIRLEQSMNNSDYSLSVR